jgi:hypothetical protein
MELGASCGVRREHIRRFEAKVPVVPCKPLRRRRAGPVA